MSRFGKLEETFDIPELNSQVPDPDMVMDQATHLADTFENTDPDQLHDEEMDEIAQLALEYGKNLHDLGMNVEVKHAGEIFTASGNMLKIASDARNAKMEKKLKLMKLELDRVKLERTAPERPELIENHQVTVLDRNELLNQIKALTQPSAK
jgi:inhibitor of KinA sporulation pathway (predicted exonuclease)